MPLRLLRLLVLCGLGGCAARVPDARPAGEKGWLKGDTQQKFDTVAKHLRGFDMAMVEVGYRYNELYFAGRNRNWGYAGYQAKKIGTATENGLERRPARAPSAQYFLQVALPQVHKAIESRDVAAFEASFEQMRLACDACHQSEQVPFIQMVTPEQRLLPFRFEGAPE